MVRLDHGGRAAQDVRLYPAPLPLRGWIQHLSVQHAQPGAGSWRVVPDTAAHLIFSMTATRAACRLVGARSTYADIAVDGRLLTIAVRLQPGALPAVLGSSNAAVLTDRVVDVADVFGVSCRGLSDELTELEPRDAMERLVRVIAARVSVGAVPVVGRALARAARVDDLQRLLGVPARALHTRLLREVGLAPKRALRIERLHAALHLTRRGDSLAAAAHGAGYSDQAHLTRDAGALLGEPPTAWLRRGR